MFQYAAGRHVSLLNNVPLKLDIGIYKTDPKRQYSLGVYQIEENIADADESSVLSVLERGFFTKVFDRLQGKKPETPKSYFLEKNPFHFDPGIFTHSMPLYLDGYFQSEQYFTAIEDVIRKDFTLKAPLSPESKELSALITETESVSLHIRRGDYAASKLINTVFGLLPMDYYRRGLETLKNVGIQPHVFLFSDDPLWCKANFKIDAPVHIVNAENLKRPDYEDLILLSTCKHHIIANSSFSWWGAWLSNYAQKRVVAPARWFISDTFDTRDLIPHSWIRV